MKNIVYTKGVYKNVNNFTISDQRTSFALSILQKLHQMNYDLIIHAGNFFYHPLGNHHRD